MGNTKIKLNPDTMMLLTLVDLLRRAYGRLERAGLSSSAEAQLLAEGEWAYATVGDEGLLLDPRTQRLAAEYGCEYLPARSRRALAAGWPCLGAREVR